MSATFSASVPDLKAFLPGPDAHLREDTESSETLLQGNFLHVKRDQVLLPSGRSASREYVVHPGAVVIIALLEEPDQPLRVLLERQYRHPIGRVMIELPAGKLDPEESPLRCAARELREETGYSAREWARAEPIHLAIAYSTEIIHVYFARGLQVGPRQLDAGEFLDVFAATPDDLIAATRQGWVTDAKTLTCLFWLQAYLRGEWQPQWQALSPESAP